MKRLYLFLFFVTYVHLMSFAQATSLEVDCQTPGHLSSLINYSDQMTVRNLKVTGYINNTDLKFIGKLIQTHSLDGCLDLNDVEKTPSNTFGSNAFGITKNDTIQKIIMPKSLISSEEAFGGSVNTIFKYLYIDSLVAGGQNMHMIKKNCFSSQSNNYIKNVIFRSGVDTIDQKAFKRNANINDVLESVIFPNSVRYIGKYAFQDCQRLKSISLSNNISIIDDQAFYGTQYMPDTLFLPDSLEHYYMTAFPLKQYQVIFIPDKVNRIYNYTVTYNNSTNTHSYNIYMDQFTMAEIHVKATTPPVVIDYNGGEYSHPTGSSFIGYTIYVPKGTKELYESTKPWSNAIIIEEKVTPQTINIEADSITLIPNESIQLIVSIFPENSDTEVIWESSDNRVATVDASGVVLARNKGKATIFATTTDGSNLSDSCIVDVIQPVDGVTLEKHSITLNVGEDELLYANVLPVNANNKNVIWSSTDAEIAEVDADGNVTAKKRGVAFIKATSEDNPLAVDSCKVTVIQPVTGVTLNHKNCKLYQIGETLQLVATVLPEDASNKEVRWASSNEQVCIVSNGTVVAVGYGTSVIIVTTVDGSFMATCTVTVVEGADLPGDVNHDGEVNIADINAIIDIILGGNVDDQTRERADVNGDGEVNIADVNAIIDIILSH